MITQLKLEVNKYRLNQVINVNEKLTYILTWPFEASVCSGNLDNVYQGPVCCVASSYDVAVNHY